VSTTTAPRIFNHRAFWTQGHGAEGLDPAILRIGDEIEFDNGRRIPAFATSTHGTHGGPFRDPRYLGPHRPTTEAQDRFAAQPARHLSSVDADGIARIVESFGHYAPGVYLVTPEGRVSRVDPPYGDGTRTYA
jgi:hypothetical protein